MKFLAEILGVNENEINRNAWLAQTLSSLPEGLRLLDAGAGELRNKKFCSHLNYVSQDICQYDGGLSNNPQNGLQTGNWDTSQIDIVSDITDIPEPDDSFDVILCSEVFEHLPDATKALDEFARLLKPSGLLITTAPFGSLVHFAPYHYATGFSKYWYEHHLPLRGFHIEKLISNGDWFNFLKQELLRLPSAARRYGDWCWPLAYLFSGIALLYLIIRNNKNQKADDLACFGWHCVAKKIGKTS